MTKVSLMNRASNQLRTTIVRINVSVTIGTRISAAVPKKKPRMQASSKGDRAIKMRLVEAKICNTRRKASRTTRISLPSKLK